MPDSPQRRVALKVAVGFLLVTLLLTLCNNAPYLQNISRVYLSRRLNGTTGALCPTNYSVRHLYRKSNCHLACLWWHILQIQLASVLFLSGFLTIRCCTENMQGDAKQRHDKAQHWIHQPSVPTCNLLWPNIKPKSVCKYLKCLQMNAKSSHSNNGIRISQCSGRQAGLPARGWSSTSSCIY